MAQIQFQICEDFMLQNMLANPILVGGVKSDNFYVN